MAVALIALVLLPAAGLASPPASFKTGTYSGKTSHGEPFSFAVKVTTCGRKTGLCLYAIKQAYIAVPCPGALATNTYADPGPILVGHSGIIRETTILFSRVVTYIKLAHNGRASGYFNATGPGACASGNVTFSAQLKRH